MKAWVRVEDENTKEIYRMEVDAEKCRIQKMDLIVHPCTSYTGGRDLWNVSDPYTGLKLGPRALGKEGAKKATRKFIKKLIATHTDPIDKLMEDIHKLWGNVMDVPIKEG